MKPLYLIGLHISFQEIPNIQGGSGDELISTIAGNTVLLPCTTEGNPVPVITWSRDNGDLPANRTVNTPIGIAIDAVQVQDTGKYTCSASNLLGTTTKTFILAVQSR